MIDLDKYFGTLMVCFGISLGVFWVIAKLVMYFHGMFVR